MNPTIPQVEKLMRFTWLSVVAVALLASGCFGTMEQRWAAFDEQMRQEVGVKTKEYYLKEWGGPANWEKLKDGGEALTWEWRARSGTEGWQKILIFSSGGILRDFKREYWPRK